MAEENLGRHNAHNSHSIERKIEKGQDGFDDGEQLKNQTVGTHTPGNHQRSETVRKGQKEGEAPQMHENRDNPEQDHVPGHMGYTRDNLVGVTEKKDNSGATLGSTKNQAH